MTKALLLSLLLALSGLNLVLWSQDPPPEGTPGEHTVPTEYCVSHDTDQGPGCMCANQHPEGCKEGHRETETMDCKSWCFKQFCRCCNS